MIRITELPLPLDYTPEALRQAILKRLDIPAAELLDFTLFKRSYDARKKNSGILFIYIVDVTVRDEAAVLKRLARDRQVERRAGYELSPGCAGAGATRGTPAGGRLRSLRAVRGAAARADGLQAHRAGARQAMCDAARTTPGGCGGRTC